MYSDIKANSQESIMDTLTLMFVTLTVLWAALFTVIVILSLKNKKLRKELSELEQRQGGASPGNPG